MKKILSAVLFFTLLQTNAQNVGIGTTVPAAKLQINHKNTNSAPVLLLFDSAAGQGSRIQFSKQGVSNKFDIVSTLTANSNTSSLEFLFNGNPRLYMKGDGRIGINNSNPQAALDITGDLLLQGKLLLNGDAGTAGQVLVSNGANNSPAWQTLTPASVLSMFGFAVGPNSNSAGRLGYNTASGNSQSDSVDISSVIYNTGSDITVNNNGLVNNFITITTSGYYHFEGMFPLVLANDQAMMPQGEVLLLTTSPNSNINQTKNISLQTLQEIGDPSDATFKYDKGIRFSFNQYFEADTKLTFKVGFRSVTSFPIQTIGYNAVVFITGYKISN